MTFIDTWLREDIKNIHSYNVLPSSGKIKLDAMESPFTLTSTQQHTLLEALKNAEINRYPTNHQQLQNTIKELMDIPNNLGVMLGNGSDELIQLLMLACSKESNILGFNPSFVMYEMIARWCNISYQSIKLDDNFDIDIENTLKHIEQLNPNIIFIAYPNNPTGNNFSREKIKRIITSTTQMVVVDEAYYAYSDDSFIDNINTFDNLVVLRTISKIGFAGLRLGVMIARSETIEQLNKLRMPYNINTLTMLAAECLLSDKQGIINNAETIKSQRNVVFNALGNYVDIKAFPSDANFILFETNNANELFGFLLQNNILIKKVSNTALRVTIGTQSENTAFLALIDEFYSGKNV